MELVHSMLPGKRALKLGANWTHWNCIFNSTISDRKRNGQDERILLYTSAKKILVNHMEKPRNLKYSRYRVLFDT